jgi:hypothetical protein
MPRKKTAEPLYDLTPDMRRVMEALCEYGGLTRAQLTVLLGKTMVYNENGYIEADGYVRNPLVKKLIEEAQYVEEVKREFTNTEGKKARILRLSTEGRHALATMRNCGIRQLGCASLPDTDRRDHFVEVNDFRVMLKRSIADADPELGIQLCEEYDDATLHSMHSADKMTIEIPPTPPLHTKERKEENVTIIPDFCFHLTAQQPRPKHYRRFVEIDRGREIVRTHKDYDDWRKKILKYIKYIVDDNNLCYKRYRSNMFFVLTVTNSEKRLANLKEATEEMGGRRRFWFTTQSRLTPRSFFTERIWEVATETGQYSFFEDPREQHE